MYVHPNGDGARPGCERDRREAGRVRPSPTFSPMERDGAMSSIYDRLRRPRVIAVAAAAGLVLTAAACSSSSTSSTPAVGATGASGQKVTISIDCAPPAAQQPVQHKERLEDLAIFEKANAQHHH